MSDMNLVGTRLGKYEIHIEIGRGGMGAVYKGYDPALDRYVAVKVLAPHLVWEKESVQRFVREARAAARLKHPGIVTIYDVGQEGGWYYFVMEYLEGETLNEFIERRGRPSPDEVVRVLSPLADALDYAHHCGLVHRDVKPGNVIVSPEGLVTLTDFGIARAAQESRLTATGTIVGTPEYMSPEQVRGLTADARSDQYSLAVMAYEMLSGQVPFEADSTLALLHMVAYEPPPPICRGCPDLPVGVEAVLNKALAKDPGDRYASSSGFVDALERALAGEEVVKSPTLVMRPPAPSPVVAETVKVPAAPIAPEDEAEHAQVAPPPPPESKVPVAAQVPPPVPFAVVAEEVAAEPAGEAVPTMELEEEVPDMEPEEIDIPVQVVSPSPPELAASAAASVSPRALARRGMPWWAWAAAGLAVLALVVGVISSMGGGQASVVAPGGGSSSDELFASYLLFVSDRHLKREIYRLGAAGVEQVTHTSGYYESWEPAAGPSGSMLFTSDRGDKREVYRLTGTGVEQVTRTPGAGESWSPALGPRDTVLFTSDRDGKSELYRLTGTGAERVTHTPGGYESWGPSLGPGGSILFTSDRDGGREVYRLTGTGIEQVTHTPGNRESWGPVLGPGGIVLFTSNRGGKREVYRLTGTGVEQVTRTPGDGESWDPAVGPGGIVLFTSNRDGKREVYRLTGEGVERVTRTPGGGESWVPAR